MDSFGKILGYSVAGGYATATGSTTVEYSGARVIKVVASGGALTSPLVSAGGEKEIGRYTDRDAHAGFYTLVAGEGAPNSGTLLVQGKQPGVWSHWSWTSGVLYSGTANTERALTISLLAGTGDGTITANFSRAENSASVWSPKARNIVIHLLNSSLVETESSISAVANSDGWKTFRKKGFTALTCASGGKTRDWYPTTNGYTSTAYLMNVSSATFSVTPITGQRVYGWKLEPAPINGVAQTMIDFGRNNSALISGFEEGCKIHLYLTSAGPYPRLVYDGFDTAGTVPQNQAVTATGTGFTATSATQWASTSAAPVKITLAPTAWRTRVLGQLRFVIIDSGTPMPLANVAGTSASVTSSAAQFSLTHVKFKQETVATDGVLTVKVVRDTIAALDGIVVSVSQEETPIGTVTATGAATGSTSGTVGYYSGANGPLRLSVALDYGDVAPSDIVVSAVIPVAEVLEGDVSDVEKLSLIATPTARAITIYVTQKVDVGTLDAVEIRLSRDVGTGELLATSAGPITQSRAGAISVTMPADTSVQVPITVECLANPGYRVKTLLVQDSTGTRNYYSGAAVLGVSSIKLGIPQANDGDDIKVILVMSAEIVGTPLMLPLLPDDLGKFSAVVHPDKDELGADYPDFRVGDSVTLNADVVLVNGSPLTGAAIGSPRFNGVTVIPVRDGTSVEATVTLVPGSNVFEIPVYAVLETATAPEGAGTITLSTAWDVEDNDTLIIDEVTYRRIGSRFTVTAPLASTDPATYTLIAGRVSLREIASGFGYHVVGVLLPVVASATTRTFTSTLRGPSKLTAVYGIGKKYPAFVVAAYDYGAGAYITQGVRPAVATTPVSPATLSDNKIADLVTDWPGSGTPGTDYRDAAFLYREVTSDDLLPGIDIRITSSVGARLEMWNPDTSLWVPYSPTGVTLVNAFTYFRVSIGDAPENLVSVAFETAVSVDAAGTETDVAGCKVYASSGAVYDGIFALPTTIQARSRSVLHVRATPPHGYTVTGWYVNDVLSLHGAALSLVVPDTGLTLKPQVAIRQVAALTVMVLNADPNQTDEGVWVSKLFRAQQPWKPLTANVVARPSDAPVTLGVLKDGGDAPEELDTESPGTVAITVTGDGMRRLPPGQIQKTRFVRYMVVASGDVSVASVAVGSGSETLKGGH